MHTTKATQITANIHIKYKLMAHSIGSRIHMCVSIRHMLRRQFTSQKWRSTKTFQANDKKTEWKKICWFVSHMYTLNTHTYTELDDDDDEVSNLKFNNGHTLTYSMNEQKQQNSLNHGENNTICFKDEEEKRNMYVDRVRYSVIWSDWTSSQSSVCLRWFPIFVHQTLYMRMYYNRFVVFLFHVISFRFTFHSSPIDGIVCWFIQNSTDVNITFTIWLVSFHSRQSQYYLRDSV